MWGAEEVREYQQTAVLTEVVVGATTPERIKRNCSASGASAAGMECMEEREGFLNMPLKLKYLQAKSNRIMKTLPGR
jgi:hypothetical protein